MPEPIDAAVLVRHHEFVLRLARALVNDAQAAADVAQTTWVRALEHPRARSGSLRGWLAAIVRHCAFNLHRDEQRRARRTRRAAQTDTTHSAAAVAARVEIERRIVYTLMALAEPYKTTLLLRYYEDLKPRDIASRLAISIDTVYSRLRRGHGALRTELERRHGEDCRQWLAAIALGGESNGGRVTALGGSGGMASGKLVAIASALVIALLVGGAIWSANARYQMTANALPDHSTLGKTESQQFVETSTATTEASLVREPIAARDVTEPTDEAAAAAITPPFDPLQSVGMSFLGGVPDVQALHDAIASLAPFAVAEPPSVKSEQACGKLTFTGLPLAGYYMCLRDGLHSVQVDTTEGAMLPAPFTTRTLRLQFGVDPEDRTRSRAGDSELYFVARAPVHRDTLERDWRNLAELLGPKPVRAGYAVDYSFADHVRVWEKEILIEAGAGGATCVTLRDAPRETAIDLPTLDTSVYDAWLKVLRDADQRLRDR